MKSNQKGGVPMVDTIRISTSIYHDELNLEKWKSGIDEETKENYYFIFINAIRIAYYPNTKTVIITGRYISFITKNKTKNFDDLFESREEILNFFSKLEDKINSYFKVDSIDILHNKITRIDYCFNICTPYVDKYIEFFNLYYCKKKDELFKRYINHTIHMELDITSAFYLKTKSQYEKNLNQNYTINFYNKANQMINKMETNKENPFKSNISMQDIIEAQNILRLEIQLHHVKLKSVCKKNKIPWDKRCLYYLFDINIARNVLHDEIKRFFTDKDFYSYKETKAILKRHGNIDKIVYDYILALAKGNNLPNSKKPIKILEKLGVFPHMFLPAKWDIDKLENPIKLIDEKIEKNNLNWLKIRN